MKPDLFEQIAAASVNFQHLREQGIAIKPPPEVIAGTVILARGMMSLEVKALAALAGVSVSSIERIERGEVVSDDVLERVGRALFYPPGAFTEPRVPLAPDAVAEALRQSVAPVADKECVAVRPFRTQQQVARICSTDMLWFDDGRLSDKARTEGAFLRERLEFTELQIGMENSSLVGVPRQNRVRRRELYGKVLDAVVEYERLTHSTVLAGTYTAKMSHPNLPRPSVAVIAVFSRDVDPRACKRRMVFVPTQIDLAETTLSPFVVGDHAST